MDDEPFLKAIGSAPDDRTLRLVYADWLDERDDPRAEYVRTQVRLWDEPDRFRADPRVQELRAGCPPYWLARLDPPVWCVVGNIVADRPAAPGEPPRRGTRLFRPNAKVFLESFTDIGLLRADLWRHATVRVIGQHRKSREWIGCWVRVGLTTNWRARLIHHPGAMVRLREAEWGGFRLRPGQFTCPAEKGSVDALQALSDAIDATFPRGG